MTMPNFETIKIEQDDAIAVLTVNRPDQLNALNAQVFYDIRDALNGLDKSVRGLIITGEGEKAFIAGADIKAMQSMSAEEAKAFSALGQAISLQIENLPMPVIAAVNGFALGGGCEMALSADFIYASDNAVFGLPEVKLGLIPGFGGTQRLAKIVGRNLAKELVYTGRNMKIEEAKQCGLVLRSFDSKEALLAGAVNTLTQSLENSSNALATVKQVMNEGNDLSVEQGLTIENESFKTIFTSDDMQEGIAAFLEKRKANFTHQ